MNTVNKALKSLKNVWSVISTVIVVIAVLFALFLVGTRLLGYRCYAVISGSMAPEYSPGDLIYIKEVDPYTIQKGESITFIFNKQLTVATHEVERVDTENRLFYTKGATNDTEDEQPVHFNNVLGVPKFSVPLLGYLATFVQSSPGMYISIAIGIALLIFVFLPDLLFKKKSEENTAGNDAPDDKDKASDAK
jgi:signal peptidase